METVTMTINAKKPRVVQRMKSKRLAASSSVPKRQMFMSERESPPVTASHYVPRTGDCIVTVNQLELSVALAAFNKSPFI